MVAEIIAKAIICMFLIALVCLLGVIIIGVCFSCVDKAEGKFEHKTDVVRGKESAGEQ